MRIILLLCVISTTDFIFAELDNTSKRTILQKDLKELGISIESIENLKTSEIAALIQKLAEKCKTEQKLKDAEIRNKDAEIIRIDDKYKTEQKLKDAEIQLKDAEIQLKDAEIKLKDEEIKLKDGEIIRIEEKYNEKRQLKEVELRQLVDKYNEERRLRLIFQTSVDLTKSIERLFERCWPQWAGRRKPKDHSPNSWKILLLNLENSKIFRLRKDLIRSNIKGTDFIEEICGFEIELNDVSYNGLALFEKKEGYEFLKQFATHEQLLVLEAFLIAADVETKAATLEPTEEHNLDTETNQSIEEERKFWKLMRIENLFTEVIREFQLKKNFETIAKEYEESHPDDDKFSKPLAYLVKEKTNEGYVLFDSFRNAYIFWELREKTLYSEIVLDSITINHVHKHPLGQGAYIKVTRSGNADSIIADFKTKVTSIRAESIYTDSKKTTLLFGYTNNENLLLDYQQMRDNLVQEWEVELIESLENQKELLGINPNLFYNTT